MSAPVKISAMINEIGDVPEPGVDWDGKPMPPAEVRLRCSREDAAKIARLFGRTITFTVEEAL